MLKFDDFLHAHACCLPTACMQCSVWLRKKKSQILEIHIFEFIFGISFKKQAIQAQTRPCSDKDFVNPPISWISHFSFQKRICEFAAHRLLSTEDSQKITISSSCVHMVRWKIAILMESEINNHQIYVHVFYLIEINIQIAFPGQNC